MRPWLRKIREEQKLTISSAAEKCGISASYYEKIESGERGVPVETAKKIANAFSFDWTTFYQ